MYSLFVLRVGDLEQSWIHANESLSELQRIVLIVLVIVVLSGKTTSAVFGFISVMVNNLLFRLGSCK